MWLPFFNTYSCCQSPPWGFELLENTPALRKSLVDTSGHCILYKKKLNCNSACLLIKAAQSTPQWDLKASSQEPLILKVLLWWLQSHWAYSKCLISTFSFLCQRRKIVVQLFFSKVTNVSWEKPSDHVCTDHVFMKTRYGFLLLVE